MRPLEGIVILDLTRVLAGPFATMILAELGATVIKVENPDGGDETRVWEPMYEGESGYFFALNRGKQSITLNLRDPRAQEIALRLAEQADVLVENFPVGTAEKFGLSYEQLKAVNPSLVYVSVTAFGQTGPYAPRKGYDTIFQAMGGLMSLTGEPGGGPVKAGLPMADLTSGLWTVIAVLTGLAGRTASGHGSHTDLSMMDVQVSLLTIAAARYFALGEVPARMGTEHPGRVPSAAFPCGDGRWVHITCSDQQWPALCKVLGLEDWGLEPGLLKNGGRVARREAVMDRLRTALAGWDRDRFVEACGPVGVPAGPVNSLDEVLRDPQVQARGMVRAFEHPKVGTFRALAVPVQLTNLDSPQLGRPPLLGEHTASVLIERLGYNQTTIEDLRQRRVI